MRLIDADAFDEELRERQIDVRGLKRKAKGAKTVASANAALQFLCEVRLALDNAPTVDAEPVRHGAWERMEVIYPEENKNAVPGAIASMFCPVCKRWHNEVYFYGNPIERVNYCNHCGAKMDANKDATRKKEEDDG